MSARARAWVGALTFGLLSLAACGRDKPEAQVFEPARPPRQRLVDTTQPGELAEGEERAFGLVLPRRTRVTSRFDDAVTAEGAFTFQAASAYLRARLEPKSERESEDGQLVLEDASVKADPAHAVQVELTRWPNGVSIVVRDRTPLPVTEPELSEEERWRRAGMQPNGEPLEELQR